MSVNTVNLVGLSLRLAGALLATVVFTETASAFDFSYRYTLLEGKKSELCRHMLAVYKKSFATPWIDDWAKAQKDGSEEYWQTLYARSPSSREFDAIEWKVHPYKVNQNAHSALYAEFDIDNDGVNDLVVHDLFFNGSPGSSDYLSVFTLDAVNMEEFVTDEDFRLRFIPRRKALLGYPIHQRPFIYNGKTYIHGYIYTPREGPGLNPSEPFAPPEYLTISEYLGGDANDAELQAHSMKSLCKYRMNQVKK